MHKVAVKPANVFFIFLLAIGAGLLMFPQYFFKEKTPDPTYYDVPLEGMGAAVSLRVFLDEIGISEVPRQVVLKNTILLQNEAGETRRFSTGETLKVIGYRSGLIAVLNGTNEYKGGVYCPDTDFLEQVATRRVSGLGKAETMQVIEESKRPLVVIEGAPEKLPARVLDHTSSSRGEYYVPFQGMKKF